MKITKLKIACKVLVLLTCATSMCHAANRSWQAGDPLSGDFSDNSRWSGSQAPGSNDTATFSGTNFPESSQFTVTLTESVTNEWIRAANGTFYMTLDLNGFEYATTRITTNGTYIQGEDVTLELTGGTATLPVFEVARSAETTGRLLLNGADTVLNVSEQSYVANAGNGTLEIVAGATLNTTAAVRSAHSSAGTGAILIEGAGSAMNVAGSTVIIGGSGSASLEVKNGGQLINAGAGGNVRFALSAGSTATGIITGHNSKLEGSGVSIGGSDGVIGGVAEVYVSDEASLVSRGTLQVFTGSLLEIESAQVSSARFVGSADSTLSLVLTAPLAMNQALIMVNTDVTLDGMSLNLSLTDEVNYAVDDVIHIISYGGTLTGTFDDIDEGDVLRIGGYDFQFSYGSETASSISLTVIPEPATVTLIVAGVVALTVCGWRSRRLRR